MAGILCNVRVKSSAKSLLDSSSGLFLLSVNSKNSKELVTIGECAEELWVELAANGYGVQPWTLAALNVYDVEVLGDIKVMSKEFKILYQDGLKTLRKSFNLSDEQIPVWLFRTGGGTLLPKDWRTKRINITKILTIADC